MKIAELLDELCRDGNCPSTLAPKLIDVALPKTFFEGTTFDGEGNR